MSHQAAQTHLNEKKASCPSPSPPVQSSSGICIKQEYFEDQLLMTRTVKTESESPPNEHNIMQSIKVEVKEEHYDDQDCVVKCELDFDEGEQIDTKIKVEVEDVSPKQSVQLCECVKKEEDGGEYVMDCDCEECETCRVKMEMKEELDESGETELGGNNAEGFTRVKKKEGEIVDVGQRPKKIQRMDRVVGNGIVVSPSFNVISINVECLNDQGATLSTHSIEDQTQTCQHVSVPFPTPIVTTQSSSSAQHVNKTLRYELLNAEPIMDNVACLVEVPAEEFDREQTDHDISTLNQVHQDDEETEVDDNQNDKEEGNETIENREDSSDGYEQVPAENFVKRIEPADELGNKFEGNYQKCERRMKKKVHLIDHIRTHTGEKPFRCSVDGCDRAFVQRNALNVHLNTHSGARPFVCSWPSCEARFGSKFNLTAHLHTHTGERPFECDQCNAAYTRQGDLVTHLRTHTGVRPFVCTWPECGQAFFTSTHLKTHSLVHSNERQFVCDVRGCTKVYKHNWALRRHQKDKHN